MKTNRLFMTAFLAFTANVSLADGSHAGGIHANSNQTGLVDASFDIVHAKISTQNNIATFHMGLAAQAGNSKPVATGKLAGSKVFSYVWPTTLNSAAVGFEDNAGILALAVTSHPDFDDTPLYDENNDNDPNNDGNVWHSHWVVLQPNEQCGKGALGVVDIPKGTKPNLPNTWPGLPILLDSPGWDPVFNDDSLEVRVAFDHPEDVIAANYDGVPLSLAEMKGKVVVIHAFQMLCPGCVSHGLPQAKAVFELYQDREVEMIGLHTVFEHHAVMTKEALTAFAHEYRIPFPLAIDKPSVSGRIPTTMEKYHMQGTPSLIILDKKGYVRLNHFGRMSDMQVGNVIGSLLSEQNDIANSGYKLKHTAGIVSDQCDDTGCSL